MTLSLAINQNIKRAHNIAAHLKSGIILGDSVAIYIYNLHLPPPPHSLPPFLPVPNKPYSFCGRQASCLLTNNNSMCYHSLLLWTTTPILTITNWRNEQTACQAGPLRRNILSDAAPQPANTMLKITVFIHSVPEP